MGYIYELHAALLKINYLLPDHYVCSSISTTIAIGDPNRNGEDLGMFYSVDIWEKCYDEHRDNVFFKYHLSETEKTIEELIEKLRKWIITEHLKESVNQQQQ